VLASGGDGGASLPRDGTGIGVSKRHIRSHSLKRLWSMVVVATLVGVVDGAEGETTAHPARVVASVSHPYKKGGGHAAGVLRSP